MLDGIDYDAPHFPSHAGLNRNLRFEVACAEQFRRSKHAVARTRHVLFQRHHEGRRVLFPPDSFGVPLFPRGPSSQLDVGGREVRRSSSSRGRSRTRLRGGGNRGPGPPAAAARCRLQSQYAILVVPLRVLHRTQPDSAFFLDDPSQERLEVVSPSASFAASSRTLLLPMMRHRFRQSVPLGV